LERYRKDGEVDNKNKGFNENQTINYKCSLLSKFSNLTKISLNLFKERFHFAENKGYWKYLQARAHEE
jgi:hypothetical protein